MYVTREKYKALCHGERFVPKKHYAKANKKETHQLSSHVILINKTKHCRNEEYPYGESTPLFRKLKTKLLTYIYSCHNDSE